MALAITPAYDLIQLIAPRSGAEDVPVGTKVTVRFAQHMKADSINASTIWLSDSQGNRVDADITYSTQDRTAVLTPLAPLSGLTRYRVGVLGGPKGVTSVLGHRLASDYTWNFETAKAEYLPAPTLLEPFDRSKTREVTPALAWSSVDGAGSYEVQVSRSPDFRVLYYQTTVPDTGEPRVELTPSSPFQSALNVSSIYFWRVRAVSDEGTPGIWSSPWQFNNATYTEPDSYLSPELEVVSVAPEPHSINAPLQTPIAIELSEDLDPSSVQIEVRVRRISPWP